EQGRPLRAEDYRTLCMASVNTHDLPPTAGYLAGDHVALRHELGLLERELDEELAADAAGREQVLDVLRGEGLLAAPGEGGDDIEQTVLALHRHLARTPSMLLGVSLVDCVGERRIQNQPGTDEEYPNCRIPLAAVDASGVSVDEIATDERTARLLAAVREGIGSRGAGGRTHRTDCPGAPARCGSAGGDLTPRLALVEEGAGGGLRALEAVVGGPAALDLVGGRHLVGREQVVQGGLEDGREALRRVVADQQHVEAGAAAHRGD